MTTFQELQQGNQFQSGTNESIRTKVMKPIIDANPDFLKITFKGIEFNLTANWSLSKKTVNYYCTISEAEYISITGSNFGFSKKNNNASINIGMTGRVTVDGGKTYHLNVSNNKDITIL